MHILIVEDEPLIARRVQNFCRGILGTTCESVSIVGSLDAATARLSEHIHDVVLLDLNLAGDDGMKLLTASVAGSFHTIVVSASTDQALRAFEHGVLDFVPKPFTQERLSQALRRVSDSNSRSPFAARCLAVRKQGRVELIPIDDVLYIEGADKYSELVLKSGKRELHDKTLSRLEAILPQTFTRIHKSYLVRMDAVLRIYAMEGSQYEAELKNGIRLPVGRTRYHELKALWQ